MAGKLLQCTVCGFLENGVVESRPCPGRTNHNLMPLGKGRVASALGAFGGRPKIYKTERERVEARRETFRRSNEKRRGKAASSRE